MAKKACGQVTTPDVDNTLEICDEIVPSSCVVVNRISTMVENEPDEVLNDYLLRLENLIGSLVYRISVLEDKHQPN